MVESVLVLKWVGGILSGTILAYIGLRIRSMSSDKQSHLNRTSMLELDYAKLSTCVSVKLDTILESQVTTRKSLARMNTAISDVTASVARIEGTLAIPKKGASTSI